MDDNNASNSLQVHKVPSMHAHQRMLGTRAPSGAVRGSSKPGDTGPEGDMSWEAGGSAHTAISEEDQMCERTQQAREEAAALDHSNHGDDSQGMLADAFSRLNGGGAGGGVGLDSEDRGSSRTDQARQQQLSYHAGDVRSQAMGYAGRLSSIQEVMMRPSHTWFRYLKHTLHHCSRHAPSLKTEHNRSFAGIMRTDSRQSSSFCLDIQPSPEFVRPCLGENVS